MKDQVTTLRMKLANLDFQGDMEVLGPTRAPVPKINKQYRWLIRIKAQRREEAASLLQAWLPEKKLGYKMRLSYTFE